VAEIAKVRAAPTVDNYNKLINQAARTLYYEVGQARNMAVVGNPQQLANDLVQYDTGQLGRLQDGTAQDQILQHVAGFEKVVKDVTAMVVGTQHYSGGRSG
jgi:hypothetical protein